MAPQVEYSPDDLDRAQQGLEAILSRSATDPEFRGRLLTDPRSALSEFAGKEMPESWDIVFIENEADATIVLPEPIDPSAELSEEELHAVAGGATTSPVCSVISVIAATLWLWDEVVERD